MNEHIKALLNQSNHDGDELNKAHPSKEDRDAYEQFKRKQQRTILERERETEQETDTPLKVDFKSLLQQDGESGVFQLVLGLTAISITIATVYFITTIITKNILIPPQSVKTNEEIKLLKLYSRLISIGVVLTLNFIISMLIPKTKIKSKEGGR